MESQSVIFFYETFEGKSVPEHKYLNNFDIAPMKSTKGEEWQSVEHYYQAHKFGDFTQSGFKEIFEEIRNAENPDICKKISRKYSKSIDKNIWNKELWDSKNKDYYMKRALTYKFSQHKDLLAKLLSTENAILKEESTKDMYWGGLLEGSLNRLGEMLMELRENYKKTKTVYLEGSNIDPIKIDL